MSRFCTPSSSFLLSSCLQCKFPRISKSCSRMQIFCFSSHHPPTVSAPHISSRCVIFPRRPNVFRPCYSLSFRPRRKAQACWGSPAPGWAPARGWAKATLTSRPQTKDTSRAGRRWAASRATRTTATRRPRVSTHFSPGERETEVWHE